MKHLNASFYIFLFLCMFGIDMNAYAVECSSTASDLKNADDACKKNKQFVLDLVRKSGRALKYAYPAMQDDEEVVEAAVMVPDTVNVFEYASPRLKRDEKFILKLLENKNKYCCIHLLSSVDETLRNDKKFMMKASENKENVFRYAGDSLKKDKEFGLFAINNEKYPYGYGSVFPQLDISLRNDIEIASAAMKRYEGVYKDFGDKLKQNRELALAALKWGPFIWRDVPQSLKDDLNFVQEAATVNPEVINYMEEKLQQDKTIVLIASRNSNKSEALVKGDFRKDKDVVLAAIEKSNGALPLLLGESFQNDKDFIRAAIKKNGGALRYAPENFIQDKEIILAAMRNSGIALAFAGKIHQQDKDVVMIAVKQNGLALAYADKTLHNNPDIVYAAAKQNAKALIYVDQPTAMITAEKLGIESNGEQVVGMIRPISEDATPHAQYFTADGKRIYVLKNGRFSQYQIAPFKLLSTFKVLNDSIPRSIQSGAQRIFVTADDSKIIIHDWKSIKLLDIKTRSVIQTVSHDSQNALLVDNALVTFGSDNILTLWNDKSLQKIRTTSPNFKWTGIKEFAHPEGGTDKWEYSLKRGGASILFMLGDKIVIYIPAIEISHSTRPGDILLIDKNTLKLDTHIIYHLGIPRLASDQKSIYVGMLDSVSRRYGEEKVAIRREHADYKYDIETGKFEVVKDNGIKDIYAGPLAGKSLYVYENGEAVLYKYKSDTLELTENARMYVWMNFPYKEVNLENVAVHDRVAQLLKQAAILKEVVPVNDATFDKFVISNSGNRSK